MKKSILFLCADQWRWDSFGFMKHKNALTPNIDALAERSTVFTSHFAGIVPCGPARATMLTSLYPFIHRSVTNGAPLDKRFTNIAKEARSIGYDPKLYGYTDTSWDPRYLDEDDKKLYTYESPMEGFDPVCHLTMGDPEVWYNYLRNNGYSVSDSANLYKREALKKNEGFIHRAYEIPTEHSDTSFLADELIKDLNNTNEPFFIHASFLKPHPPMFVSEPWHSLINPDDIDLPFMDKTHEELSKDHPFLKEIIRIYSFEQYFPEINFKNLTKKDIQNIISVYLGMCAEVDCNIGKILSALKENNLDQNTMVIFTSDHGEMLGEHRQWGKFGWWDSSFRIPLIINLPNQKHQIVDDFTESVDIAPTILDWINGNIPMNWNGRSLISKIKNQKDQIDAREFVIFEFDFRESHYSSFVENKILAPEECSLIVIRTKKWKYVHFISLPPLLFNIKDDPNETCDLSKDPTFEKIKFELLSKLLDHKRRHAERFLSNKNLGKDGVKENSGPANRKINQC
jgi:arylsulfatase A-like enzyme